MSKSTSTLASPTTHRATRLLLVGALAAAVIIIALFVISPGWANVVLLGMIEGVTEFLPISSTAHLLIAAKILNFQHSAGGTFEIFIQFGAVLAVLGYYARDLIAQARAIPTSPTTRHFWLAILIAFIPAAVIGLLLHTWIKQVLFESPTLIATTLIVGGFALVAIERIALRVQTRELEQTSFGQALEVGFAQVLALVPGVSRSAASIAGGMLGGLERQTATKFSFYLAIPTLGAATVVDLLSSLKQVSAGDVGPLIVGTLVALVVAWLSIGWLLRYVARHSFTAFGVYRILIGVLVLALVVIGRL